MPIYDMLEYQMVKRNIPNGWVSRLIYRSIYVAVVAFVAITIPFFCESTHAHLYTSYPQEYGKKKVRRCAEERKTIFGRGPVII